MAFNLDLCSIVLACKQEEQIGGVCTFWINSFVTFQQTRVQMAFNLDSNTFLCSIVLACRQEEQIGGVCTFRINSFVTFDTSGKLSREQKKYLIPKRMPFDPRPVCR